MKICDELFCTACGACVNSCPVGCIDLRQDALASCKYHIDEERCISCGLCERVCPVIEAPTFRRPIHCFAASNENTANDPNVASGGIATALYMDVLSRKGVIIGAGYRDGQFVYFAAEEACAIERFRNSKYVRCDLQDIYSITRNYLDNKREVLFVGLPCQIAGLLKYLRKEYSNLTTVDLLCHGAPPQEYIKEYLGKNKQYNTISFRENGKYQLSLANKADKLKTQEMSENAYMLPYIQGLIFSDCCYTCRYARPERISDITIGDFWGFNEAYKTTFINQRISCVLANTTKGLDLFSSIESIQKRECSLNDIAVGNLPLCHPVPRGNRRKKFEKLYPKFGYTITMHLIGIYKNILFNRLYSLWKKMRKRKRT